MHQREKFFWGEGRLRSGFGQAVARPRRARLALTDRLWSVSNLDSLTGPVQVEELYLYSDRDCSVPVPAPSHVYCYAGGAALNGCDAVADRDFSTSTAWPCSAGQPCAPGDVALVVRVPKGQDVQCAQVVAPGTAFGSGLALRTSTDAGATYATVAETAPGAADASAVSVDNKTCDGPIAWELAVPNGVHSVRIGLAGAGAFAWTSKCELEGVPLGANAAAGQVTELTRRVEVQDGRLTFTGTWAEGCEGISYLVVEDPEDTDEETWWLDVIGWYKQEPEPAYDPANPVLPEEAWLKVHYGSMYKGWAYYMLMWIDPDTLLTSTGLTREFVKAIRDDSGVVMELHMGGLRYVKQPIRSLSHAVSMRCRLRCGL